MAPNGKPVIYDDKILLTLTKDMKSELKRLARGNLIPVNELIRRIITPVLADKVENSVFADKEASKWHWRVGRGEKQRPETKRQERGLSLLQGREG
jgi:hypothetical protein